MSPDAVFGVLHMFDHWRLMLAQLQGQPLPELPPLPGRVFRLPEPTTPEADAAARDKEMQAAIVWHALADDTEGGTND